jgi:hypothetical protein
MALFGRVHLAYSRPKRVIVRKVYALPARQPRPTGFIGTVDVLCNGEGGRNHPLPCRMKRESDGRSNSGQPMTTYVCGICGARKAFVRDSHSGVGRLLFQRPGRKS